MTYSILFEPTGNRLLCEESITIYEAARLAGLNLNSECGGKATCGKCRVRVAGNDLSAPTKSEIGCFSADQLANDWRLACCTIATNDVTVYIPTTSLIEEQVIQVDGVLDNLDPSQGVQLFSLKVPRPSLDDQLPDLERLTRVLNREHSIECVRANLPAIRSLSEALRAGDWRINVALRKDELVAAYPGPPLTPIGLAVDVGTSKLACYLVDLRNGQTLATKGVSNPQIAYGEDVMSRLSAVMIDQVNASKMQGEVIEAINSIADELCESQGLSQTDLLELCLVGNTAMHHILSGLPIHPLAVLPFVPALNLPLNVPASQLGLIAAPGARSYLPGPLAGFIGSDHSAFLLAADFGNSTQTRLGIDIGTNTEITLQIGNRIVSCSTASGPAFEGAHIRHGMRAAHGAIERIEIDEAGKIKFDVIGGGSPRGICGSGILDSIAELRSADIINGRGRFIVDKPGVVSRPNLHPYFELIPKVDGNREIIISQEDIDQVLLAKGAIRAGIDILLNSLDVSPHEINEVVIAGAFGTNIDAHNAVKIGLLPRIPINRIRAVGNAAGAGARMMLVSEEARLHAIDLAKKIEYIELTVSPDFNKYFANAVRLPAPLLT